ncbi:c-type cytochrome [Cognataquiflexum rubidum]|uniref:c-type cytochrome n=1 Tax=Cognataquiflexum rubidum TaxID=2922273 RepID=UPI001F12A38D|nr:c-type cytochrome [Cognataquiflexum rubidum]MCH6235553.1 c-type cytochrome [Cognataquiflexum rubidum]
MKLIKSLTLGLIAASALTYSCGGGSTSETATTETAVTTPPPAAAPVSLEDKYKDDPIFIAGQAKTKEAACTACHMVERKVVGPSYADVAAKYENTPENIALLTKHVIEGHVGTWGEVPMTAHPHLDPADVEAMVKYVLLLKR